MTKEKNDIYYQDSISLLENSPPEKKQAAEIKNKCLKQRKCLKPTLLI